MTLFVIFKCKCFPHLSLSVVQFNKMSHNCAGWSVLGVVAEGEDLTMDYIREEDLPEQGNNGYNLRTSDRLENQLRKRNFAWDRCKVSHFLCRKEKAGEMTVTIQHFTWDEVRFSPPSFPEWESQFYSAGILHRYCFTDREGNRAERYQCSNN